MGDSTTTLLPFLLITVSGVWLNVECRKLVCIVLFQKDLISHLHWGRFGSVSVVCVYFGFALVFSVSVTGLKVTPRCTDVWQLSSEL